MGDIDQTVDDLSLRGSASEAEPNSLCQIATFVVGKKEVQMTRRQALDVEEEFPGRVGTVESEGI